MGLSIPLPHPSSSTRSKSVPARGHSSWYGAKLPLASTHSGRIPRTSTSTRPLTQRSPDCGSGDTARRCGADSADGGGEEWDILAQTDDGDLVLEKCFHAPEQSVCNTGAPEDLNGKGVSNASLATHDVDTRFVNLGVACNPNGFKSCATANDAGYPYGSFNLWASVVTIRDDVRPTLTPGGSIWADGWHRPSEALSYDTRDSAGIRSVQAQARQRGRHGPGILRLPPGGALFETTRRYARSRKRAGRRRAISACYLHRRRRQ